MRPWDTWLYGLGLAGALAFGLAGCGGGDVPDPSSDEMAASDEGGEAEAGPSMPPPPQAPAPAPAPGIAAAPAAAPAPAPPTDPVAAAAASPAPAPDAPPAASPADAQPATKSETAEMLALASGAAAPAPSVVDAPPGPASGSPGAEPDAGQLAFPGGLNPNAMNGPGGEAAARGGFGPAGPGGPGGPGGSAGIPGLGGGPGGASELKQGDTNSPTGAVEAFLYALSKKDRDRLMEATALRSTTVEEGGKFRELFSRILDVSISDSEMDDLASKLEGFRPAGQNQVKSTGRQGVTIRKDLKDGGWLQRTVTVRKEKKGWGVLDISGATSFDGMRAGNQRRR